MKGSCKIGGGSIQEREVYNIMVFVALIIGLGILMALMWSNNIQFASDDQKNLVAGLITAVMIILIFYVLYLATVRGQTCELNY